MARRAYRSINDFEDELDRTAAARFRRRTAFEHGNWAALFDAIAAAIARYDPENPDSEDQDALVGIPLWAAVALTEEVFPNFLKKVPIRGAKTRRGLRLL